MTNLEKKLIYLICPVEKATADQKIFLDGYVRGLEAKGYQVHYPPRDVNQEDETGLNIVLAHKKVMERACAVHAYWCPDSNGSKTDLGMLLMAEKPLFLINALEIEAWLKDHPGKSLTRIAYELHKQSLRSHSNLF